MNSRNKLLQTRFALQYLSPKWYFLRDEASQLQPYYLYSCFSLSLCFLFLERRNFENFMNMQKFEQQLSFEGQCKIKGNSRENHAKEGALQWQRGQKESTNDSNSQGFQTSLQQLDKMIFNSQKFSFILLLLAFAVPTLQMNWQGTGSMNNSVLSEIYLKMNENPIAETSGSAFIDGVAQIISTHLNTLYDPAWNVVICKAIQPYDTILYAYSYRNQWMWINGIPIPATTDILSYLVWKDYSCSAWGKIQDINRTAPTMSSAQKNILYDYTPTKIGTDVWGEAFAYSEYMNSNAEFRGNGYAIVATQYQQARFYGYICVVNKVIHEKAVAAAQGGGKLFTFLTRQGQ